MSTLDVGDKSTVALQQSLVFASPDTLADVAHTCADHMSAFTVLVPMTPNEPARE